jgi:hypothetical protein
MPDGQPWVPKLSQKQLELFNCYHRYVLAAGGRRNGKTIGVGHKVFRHLWETQGARVGLVAKTIRSAKEGGAWSDLIEIVAPEWLGSGICGQSDLPIEYTTQSGSGIPGPRLDSATRTSSFRIRNWWGGESELILISLDNDEEAEVKLKSLRFSMFWFSELSNFKTRKVFKASIQQLRMFHLKDEQHQWISDTNPAEDGEDSWIYNLWFKERDRKDHPDPEFQSQLKLFEFHLEDNPFLTPFQISELKGSNCDNQGEYDRNVLGKWTKGFGMQGKVFADVFQPNFHIIKPAIDLEQDTEKLFTGWDMGQVNFSYHILECRIVNNLRIWMVIEELLAINDQIGTEEFGYQAYAKQLALEAHYERRFDWTHWSDDTALNVWRAAANGYDAGMIMNVTGGAVQLQAADKPKESVPTGIKIIRTLLRENRFFVGENCPKTIQMISDLNETDIENDTELKHPFDSLRYPIYMEERRHIITASRPAPRSLPAIHL